MQWVRTQFGIVPGFIALSGFIHLDVCSIWPFIIRQNSHAGGGYCISGGATIMAGFSGKKVAWNTLPFSELSYILHAGCLSCLITRLGTLDCPPSEVGCDMKLQMSHILLLPAASSHSIQHVIFALSVASAYILHSLFLSSCTGWFLNILNLYAFFCTLHRHFHSSVSSPVHHRLMYRLGLVHGTYISMVS